MKAYLIVLLAAFMASGCDIPFAKPRMVPPVMPVSPAALADDITVCHEAGHALYAYASGYGIDHAALARRQLIDAGRGEPNRGAVFFKSGHRGPRDEVLWNNCALSMAGFAGEILCNGSIRLYDGPDLSDAGEAAAWLLAQPVQKAPWQNSQLPASPATPDMLRECQRHAQETLAMKPRQFATLRYVFLYDEDGLVSGEEIASLLEKT